MELLKLKKVMMRNCVDCGYPVSGGGNRHAADRHVIRSRQGERWLHRRSREKARKQRASDMVGIVRGVAVAGTGKPSASSGEKAGVKKGVGKWSIVARFVGHWVPGEIAGREPRPKQFAVPVSVPINGSTSTGVSSGVGRGLARAFCLSSWFERPTPSSTAGGDQCGRPLLISSKLFKKCL